MKTSSTNPSSIFLGYVVDVVAPMALFFVLSRLGCTADLESAAWVSHRARQHDDQYRAPTAH